MSSGWLESRRIRFDPSHGAVSHGPTLPRPTSWDDLDATFRERLENSIARSRDYLLAIQHDEGYWVG
ncbi:MAG TPA: hypothetical protein EYP14_11880, partial [Planctomycetaceae bacterium]|nr:hypothetical protein [Planctomycetaceae bacterium]